MNSEIEIIEKEIGNSIEIEENVPMWKMPFVIKKDFQKIMDFIKSENREISEMPYTRFINVDWEAEMSKSKFAIFMEIFTRKWNFKVGIPVQDTLQDKEDLICLFIPKKKYVKTMHKGPYQKVGETYKRMYEWIKTGSISAENESIEIYLNDPRETKKQDLETMVLIPVKQNH